eukprot:jgi/Mesvir1/28613/Mv25477-RA.1
MAIMWGRDEVGWWSGKQAKSDVGEHREREGWGPLQTTANGSTTPPITYLMRMQQWQRQGHPTSHVHRARASNQEHAQGAACKQGATRLT